MTREWNVHPPHNDHWWEKTCVRCGKTFWTDSDVRIYCGDDCRKAAQKQQHVDPRPQFPSAEQGAELFDVETAHLPANVDDPYARVPDDSGEVLRMLDGQEVVYAHRVDHRLSDENEPVARLDLAIDHVNPKLLERFKKSHMTATSKIIQENEERRQQNRRYTKLKPRSFWV